MDRRCSSFLWLDGSDCYRENNGNPFDRTPLSINELIEYNKRPEIKVKINKFLEEKSKWIQNHKL